MSPEDGGGTPAAASGPVMRRTAAGGAGVAVELAPLRLGNSQRIALDTEPALGDDSDSDYDAEDKRIGRTWRRARRMLDTPAMAIFTGVMIWLICFLLVDDPFNAAAVGEAAPGESLREEDPKGADADPREPVAGEGAASFRSDGRDAEEGNATFGAWVQDLEGSVLSSIDALWWQGPQNATRAADGEDGAAGGDDENRTATPQQRQHMEAARKKAWFDRLAGVPSLANAGDSWHRGTERIRKEGEQLRLAGRQRFQKKQEELKRKREQVQTASMALASKISTGEVHGRVVFLAVAAFVACAVTLQVLASARADLRQFVRALVAKSMPVQLAPNELVTRPYTNWAELTVRVTLDFLNEPANLMLISIGSLQVLATWSKADPWRCKKINLLVLLLNFAYTLVQEVRAQWIAAKHDDSWNSIACERLAVGSNTILPVLAKDICIGDTIRLCHGDKCPATGELVRASHSFILFNSLCETGEDCCSVTACGGKVLRGFVLALEGAEAFIRITATRNETSGAMVATPSVSKLGPAKSRRMERFPEHMNALLTKANLAALALLFCQAALASALACAFGYHSPSSASTASPTGPTGSAGAPQADALSQTEWLLVTHFFSAAVQFNTVIPSMRWVVLFFLYVFLIEAARPEVSVQNWRAFRGLEHRRILYSDKTGTLTEVGMHVSRLRFVDTGADVARPEGSLGSPSRRGGSEDVAWLASVLMACNDSQARPQPGCRGSGAEYLGLRPGTSPEEIAVAEHLEDTLGLIIKSNPLQPGSEPPSSSSSASGNPLAGDKAAEAIPIHTLPLVLQDKATRQEVARVSVLSRTGFNPAAGCREARIVLSSAPDDVWIVRQGGADLMAELAGQSAREGDLAREDQDRALGWSIARLDANGQPMAPWRYVLRVSFANPPRAASAAMVAHCRNHGLSVRMLTGDACIAALYIARQIGILDEASNEGDVVHYIPDEPPASFSLRVTSQLARCPRGMPLRVVVPGTVVRRLIEAGGGSDAWLADERTSAVIYRTKAADKALIVGRTEELGRARQRRALAGAQLPCLAPPRVEEGVCWMLGDAANDAEAISLEGVIGISLRHGATPCKLGADFIIDGPGALMAIRTELHGRALVGAQWLLEDVCLLCGLISSLTLCGVWAAGFKFLPRGFLYDDPFDARIMAMFSGGLYPISACSAACAAARAAFAQVPSPAGPEHEAPEQTSSACAAALCAGGGRGSGAELSASPVRSLATGVCLGLCLGLVGPTDSTSRLGRYILTATCSVCILRHTLQSVMTSGAWTRRPLRVGQVTAFAKRALLRLGLGRSARDPADSSPRALVTEKRTTKDGKGDEDVARSRPGPVARSTSCAAWGLEWANQPRTKLVLLSVLLMIVWF